MDALASLRAYLERPPAKRDKAPTGFDQQLKATIEPSRLRLSIYLHKIPYLAKALFDVDADVKDMMMYST